MGAAARLAAIGLSYLRPPLEVQGAKIAQDRVHGHGFVEALDVIEHVLPCVVARAVGFRAIRSGLQ